MSEPETRDEAAMRRGERAPDEQTPNAPEPPNVPEPPNPAQPPSAAPERPTNPYVGPRAFKKGEALYGRTNETLALLDLLVAERIVLLYSPSGAGKSSLIEAALLPRCARNGFSVVPTIRVNLPLPDGAPADANRFIVSALASVEKEVINGSQSAEVSAAAVPTPSTVDATPSPQIPPVERLESLIERLNLEPSSYPLLVFDQFEEILTIEPANVQAKHDFFKELGELLQQRRMWALFAMREDYLAALAPYLHWLPTQLANTFRLNLLDADHAKLAIQNPARKAGVDFTDGAVQKLADDLRRVRVQKPDGSMVEEYGAYIEPVQLQVVCLRLWEQPRLSANEIVQADIQEAGDVDTALADYYALEVGNTAERKGISEQLIRDWFDRELITPDGIRTQVLREAGSTKGLPNDAIQCLIDAHLIRKEDRGGRTWFELAHDRLVRPIRAANAIPPDLSPKQRNLMQERLGQGGEAEAQGYAMLLAMFDRAESGHYREGADLLVRLASEQEERLTPEHKQGVVWLKGRMARLQLEPEKAIAILEPLYRELPASELRARVAFSLAQACGDERQWTSQMEFAQAAGNYFRESGLRRDEARATIELARGLAGHAGVQRHTPAEAWRKRRSILSILANIGKLIARTPLLIYLVAKLNLRRLLPALDSIGAGQDWIMAKALAATARTLEDIEYEFLPAYQQEAVASVHPEPISMEAHRTRALVLLALGHPLYAAQLFSDQASPVLLRKSYRGPRLHYELARLTLDLAQAHNESGEHILASEQLATCVTQFDALGDMRNEGRAHLLMGEALWAAAATQEASRAELVTNAIDALDKSLALYAKLGLEREQAEVAEVLDEIAGQKSFAANNPLRTRATATAANVPSRWFVVPFAHPWTTYFRNGAVVALALVLLLVLYLGMRSSSDTQVQATALTRIGQVEATDIAFVADVKVELVPTLQLPLGPIVRLDPLSILVGLMVFALLYLLFGLLLIATAPTRLVSTADTHYFAVSGESIRKFVRTRVPAAELRWKSIAESFQFDRKLNLKPVPSISHLALFGDSTAIDVPGRTSGYGGTLESQIIAHLPARPHRLGFSLFRSLPGAIFLFTLALQIGFLILSQLEASPVVQDSILIEPYALSDLYIYSFLGLLLPLGWWMVIVPLREAFILDPTARWVFVVGGVSLVAFILFLAGAWFGVTRFLPRPDIYPVLSCAFIVAAVSVFIARVRRWEQRPARRTTPVYPLLARIAMTVVGVGVVAAALYYSANEIRAYHSLIEGNDLRDEAAELIVDGNDQEAVPLLKSAEAEYQNSVGYSPNNYGAHSNLGATQFVLGKLLSDSEYYKKALGNYTESLRLNPQQPHVYASEAVAYLGLAELQAGPAGLVLGKAQLPDVIQALQAALESYAIAESYAVAERYAVADRYDEKTMNYVGQQAVIDYLLNRLIVAEDRYNELLRHEPEYAHGFAGRGWVRFQLARDLRAQTQPSEKSATDYFQKAGADFVHADELFAQQPQTDILELHRASALHGVGWINYVTRQFTPALEFFRRASGFDPDPESYRLTTGVTRWRISTQTDSASQEYVTLIEQSVEDMQAGIKAANTDVNDQAFMYRTLGQLYFLLNNKRGHDFHVDLNKALAADDEAIRLDGDEPEYYLRRGQIGLELARKLIACTTCAQTRPEALTRFDRAIDDLHRVLETEKSGTYATEARSALTLANMGRAREYVVDGDFLRAAERYRDAYAIDPRRTGLAEALANALHRSGQDSEAVETLARFLELDRNNDRARFQRAFVRLAAGDEEAAQADYAEAIAFAKRHKAADANALYMVAQQELLLLKSEKPELGPTVDEILTLLTAAQAVN